MLHDNENNLPADHQPGANFPPGPIESDEVRRLREAFEAARLRIDAEVKTADEWMADIVAVKDEKTAEDLGTKLNQITDFIKLYDGMRAEEKRPHDEAAAAVQKHWAPLLEKLLLCKKALQPLETAWHKLKQKRIDDEREAKRRAAAEAQRRADQLAEQATARSANTVTNMATAMEATQEAERLRQEAAAMPLRAQTRGIGRTRSLHTVWRADLHVIEDAFGHYKHKAEVKALLTRLANADARAGVRWIPGFYVHEEQV